MNRAVFRPVSRDGDRTVNRPVHARGDSWMARAALFHGPWTAAARVLAERQRGPRTKVFLCVNHAQESFLTRQLMRQHRLSRECCALR